MPRYTFTANARKLPLPFAAHRILARVTAPDRETAVKELNERRLAFMESEGAQGDVQRVVFSLQRLWREEDITVTDTADPPPATTEAGPLFNRERLEAAYDAHYQKARSEGADHDAACEAAGNFLSGILARHLRIFRDKHNQTQLQHWQQLRQHLLQFHASLAAVVMEFDGAKRARDLQAELVGPLEELRKYVDHQATELAQELT